MQASSTPCLPLDSFVLNGLAYSLHMSLDAGVVSEPFDNTGSASDPFPFSLSPTQSGVQVLSVSGFSYFSQPTPPPTPAPEPNTLVLLVSGLACLLPVDARCSTVPKSTAKAPHAH